MFRHAGIFSPYRFRKRNNATEAKLSKKDGRLAHRTRSSSMSLGLILIIILVIFLLGGVSGRLGGYGYGFGHGGVGIIVVLIIVVFVLLQMGRL
jgi:Protein of unknown function (DUF3309)